MTTRVKRLRLVAQLVYVLPFFAGCSGSGDSSQLDEASPAPPPTVNAAPIAVSIEYGTHEPNGAAAFRYMVGPEGTWKDVSSVRYEWSFYVKCAVPGRPFDRNTLLASADGSRFFTAPDADCNLLWDANADGQLDAIGATQAFHEHNGRGFAGQQLAAPFTIFWFDDNWLARYAAQIYGHAAPDGLSEAPRVRWRILDGNTAGWTRYPDDTFDRRALNGIHDVVTGDFARATEQWQRILGAAGFFYDPQTQRYVYPNIDENYQLALVEILVSLLMDRAASADLDDALVQHWVSLRSNILSRQERRGGELLGWRSSFSDLGSLMNTETMSLSVMALGAGAVAVFEAGQPPLTNESPGNYIRTADNVLAARVGAARPGYMTVGPAGSYPAGEYEIQFFIRGGVAAGAVARLEIANARSAAVLDSREIVAAELPAGAWRRVDMRLNLNDAQTRLEMRTYWYGTASLDVGAIRIRRL